MTSAVAPAKVASAEDRGNIAYLLRHAVKKRAEAEGDFYHREAKLAKWTSIINTLERMG